MPITPHPLLEKYLQDGPTQALARSLSSPKLAHTRLKTPAGSLGAVLLAACFAQENQSHLVVLPDREEAMYFANDLRNLLGQAPPDESPFNPAEDNMLFFASSYHRPYQLEKIDNANVLLRAEILNAISNFPEQKRILVTYPDALTERVVSRKTLIGNSFSIKKGEEIDLAFLQEVLNSYGFDSQEFVTEPGQFAVRGGIVDVYSFSNDFPYRIEFWGDEVESIRMFNPETQLSVREARHVSLIPNTSQKMEQEVREDFLTFLPKNTTLWFRDYSHTEEVLNKYFRKASAQFEEILEKTGRSKLYDAPEELYQTPENFAESLQQFHTVELGDVYTRKKILKKNKAEKDIEILAEKQPDFKKSYTNLSEEIAKNEAEGWTTCLVAEHFQPLDRMREALIEHDPNLQFETQKIGLHEGFRDAHLRLACYTDHQFFARFHRYRSKERFNKSKALTLKELNSLQPGDYVTHIDHGVGRFAGLHKVEINDKMQEAVRLVYRDNDLLYVSIHSLHKIARYSGQDGTVPSLNKLGSPEWEKKKKSVKKRLQEMGSELIQLYAKRRAAKGHAYESDSWLQREMEDAFIYEPTPDQLKASIAVKEDLEKPYPMDRLICGDVGFGKTEIAMRAAFKVASQGKQVAVLVPTTILAAQHARNFKKRLGNFGIKVDFINRFRTARDITQIKKDLAEGNIDILIGTHKIVGKTIKFKDLGLFIIDEEQKFGVRIKEKLKQYRVNVDCLTMTATPIPRTLQFSLLGARDFSVIHTPPPNRQPVRTELHLFEEHIIRDAVAYELQRGGQVFFVHNRIGDIYEIAGIISRLVPDARVSVGHGQMQSEKMEKVMMDFINHETDVLVSTNIIESGLDISNANTIIINHAHMFGLSDLHQMRGRVGRSNRKAYCILLTPQLTGLTAEARKRLRAMEEFSELGSGFEISMRDLDIRGAGDLLGAEQSGFINDLGFETYQKILNEAIEELKEKEFRDLFEGQVPDADEIKVSCQIETDLEIRIPEDYVANISERLQLYIEADNIKNEEELEKFAAQLKDRFGPAPSEVDSLFETVRLRWGAERLGFEKLFLKGNKLKGYFVSENEKFFQTEAFGKVLTYMKQHPKRTRLKESGKRLIFIAEKVANVSEGMKMLEAIWEG